MAKMHIRMAGLVPSAAAAGLVVIASAALAGCGPVRAGAAHPAAASRPSTGQASAGPSPAGQSPAGQPGATPVANGPVCRSPAAVSAVRVTRIPSLSQLGPSKPLRRVLPRITVRDPGKARALARAVCGLPVMPHGILSCPIDVGGGYRLDFIAAGRALHPVTVEATGCQTVTGAGAPAGPGQASTAPASSAPAGTGPASTGPTRWVARTPGFWTTFAHLTGIQAPAHSQ